MPSLTQQTKYASLIAPLLLDQGTTLRVTTKQKVLDKDQQNGIQVKAAALLAGDLSGPCEAFRHRAKPEPALELVMTSRGRGPEGSSFVDQQKVMTRPGRGPEGSSFMDQVMASFGGDPEGSSFIHQKAFRRATPSEMNLEDDPTEAFMETGQEPVTAGNVYEMLNALRAAGQINCPEKAADITQPVSAQSLWTLLGEAGDYETADASIKKKIKEWLSEEYLKKLDLWMTDDEGDEMVKDMHDYPKFHTVYLQKEKDPRQTQDPDSIENIAVACGCKLKLIFKNAAGELKCENGSAHIVSDDGTGSYIALTSRYLFRPRKFGYTNTEYTFEYGLLVKQQTDTTCSAILKFVEDNIEHCGGEHVYDENVPDYDEDNQDTCIVHPRNLSAIKITGAALGPIPKLEKEVPLKDAAGLTLSGYPRKDEDEQDVTGDVMYAQLLHETHTTRDDANTGHMLAIVNIKASSGQEGGALVARDQDGSRIPGGTVCGIFIGEDTQNTLKSGASVPAFILITDPIIKWINDQLR